MTAAPGAPAAPKAAAAEAAGWWLPAAGAGEGEWRGEGGTASEIASSQHVRTGFTGGLPLWRCGKLYPHRVSEE